MGFCDHCEGQRFDRARVLRALRAARRRVRAQEAICTADQTFRLAIEAVSALDIPHLEFPDEWADGEVIH